MAEGTGPAQVRELIPRLPRTFGPALNEQLRSWDLLFPAEQRLLTAQLRYFAGLPPERFKALFAPIVALESRMQLPRLDPNAAGLSVQDTGILARSPLYPQWRDEVEKVFAQADSELAKTGAIPRRARVVVCALPAGVPAGSQPIWPELEKSGTWVKLDTAFGAVLPKLARAVAGRELASDVEPVESTWVFECETALSPLAESTPATVMSWTALAGLRREFLNRLNSISRTLDSVDKTNADLRRMDIAGLIGKPLGERKREREFIRSVLLSGNGSLVFNNSFVQWGAAEALRRAEPQAVFACFGIRQKLKPFSSTVLFEDQNRGNPVADADDPAGSLVDAAMLSQYVYLATQGLDAYRGRTLTVMAAGAFNRVLVLDAKAPGAEMTGDGLCEWAQSWLNS